MNQENKRENVRCNIDRRTVRIFILRSIIIPV